LALVKAEFDQAKFVLGYVEVGIVLMDIGRSGCAHNILDITSRKLLADLFENILRDICNHVIFVIELYTTLGLSHRVSNIVGHI